MKNHMEKAFQNDTFSFSINTGETSFTLSNERRSSAFIKHSAGNEFQKTKIDTLLWHNNKNASFYGNHRY